MESHTTPRTDGSVPRCLRDPRPRRVLRVLAASVSPLSVDALVTRLAEAETDGDGPSANGRRSLHVDLVHSRLPALDEAGVVDWDRRAETVTSTADAVLPNRLLEWLSSPDPPLSGDALVALAHAPRPLLLSILRDGDATTVAELSRLIRANQRASGEDPADSDRLRSSLHHVHLPVLDDAGLVDYDPDADSVTEDAAVADLDEWLSAFGRDGPREP